MTTPNISRFPNAAQNPSRLEDVARAVSAIQSAVVETLPEVESLSSPAYPAQVVVHKTGGSLTLKWYDDLLAAWRVLDNGTSGGYRQTILGTTGSLALTGPNTLTLVGSGITCTLTGTTTMPTLTLTAATPTAPTITAVDTTNNLTLVNGTLGFSTTGTVTVGKVVATNLSATNATVSGVSNLGTLLFNGSTGALGATGALSIPGAATVGGNLTVTGGGTLTTGGAFTIAGGVSATTALFSGAGTVTGNWLVGSASTVTNAGNITTLGAATMSGLAVVNAGASSSIVIFTGSDGSTVIDKFGNFLCQNNNPTCGLSGTGTASFRINKTDGGKDWRWEQTRYGSVPQLELNLPVDGLNIMRAFPSGGVSFGSTSDPGKWNIIVGGTGSSTIGGSLTIAKETIMNGTGSNTCAGSMTITKNLAANGTANTLASVASINGTNTLSGTLTMGTVTSMTFINGLLVAVA